MAEEAPKAIVAASLEDLGKLLFGGTEVLQVYFDQYRQKVLFTVQGESLPRECRTVPGMHLEEIKPLYGSLPLGEQQYPIFIGWKRGGE